MRARLAQIWDRAAPVVFALGIFIGVMGVAYGVNQSRLAHSVAVGHTGQIDEQTAILKQLQAGGMRHTAEIQQLAVANKELAQIFGAAAVEEQNLLNYQVAICRATPGCVAPALIPVPAVKKIP